VNHFLTHDFIEIFFQALEKNHYDCWLSKDQALPMIYVDDCIRATLDFLKAPKSKLKRQVYNLAGISFTPEMLVAEVQKLIPGFTVNYDPCQRRSKIAASWPRSIDDIEAQKDWGWKYQDSMYELAFKILNNIDDQYKTNIIE
jgi:nucleoside-diphosphate-sugar epimerase